MLSLQSSNELHVIRDLDPMKIDPTIVQRKHRAKGSNELQLYPQREWRSQPQKEQARTLRKTFTDDHHQQQRQSSTPTTASAPTTKARRGLLQHTTSLLTLKAPETSSRITPTNQPSPKLQRLPPTYVRTKSDQPQPIYEC